MRTAIGRKVLAAFGAIIILVLINNVFGLRQFDGVSTGIDAIADEAWPAANATMELRIEVLRDIGALYLDSVGETQKAAKNSAPFRTRSFGPIGQLDSPTAF